MYLINNVNVNTVLRYMHYNKHSVTYNLSNKNLIKGVSIGIFKNILKCS